MVDLVVKQRLLLDTIDAYLLSGQTLVDEDKRALVPVLRERQALADSLARYLAMLGLQRRARPMPSFAEHLEARQ